MRLRLDRMDKNSSANYATGLISDSQRNLILQHSSSAVFQHNYLSRYITQDTQAIYRGLDPQTAVIRAASGMSRSIDRRQPRSLNKSQLAEVGRHPEVKLLLRVRNNLAKRIREKYRAISRTKGTKAYEAYQQACRAYRSKRKAVRKTLMAEVKASYRKQQPLADIASQLAGPSVKQQDRTDSGSGAQVNLSEERCNAISALFTFATSDPAEECRRRSEAIKAVTALSKCQRPGVKDVCRARSSSDTEGEVQAEESKAAPEPFPIECGPTQCIFCLGNPELSLEDRRKTFRNRDGLKRHFHRKHLRHNPDGEPIDCPHPKCDAGLSDKVHLQNHAATVHKTFT